MMECTEPEGRGQMLAKFMARGLGEWGMTQFARHLGVCNFCTKEVVTRLLERALAVMSPAEQEVVLEAIKQWRQ